MYKDQFEKYLKEEKKSAGNTSRAYIRDVEQFSRFLKDRDLDEDVFATNADVVAFLMELKNAGSSKSTVNRKLSSIRIYYDFLMKKAGMASNPADNIKSPKIEKKSMVF